VSPTTHALGGAGAGGIWSAQLLRSRPPVVADTPAALRRRLFIGSLAAFWREVGLAGAEAPLGCRWQLSLPAHRSARRSRPLGPDSSVVRQKASADDRARLVRLVLRLMGERRAAPRWRGDAPVWVEIQDQRHPRRPTSDPLWGCTSASGLPEDPPAARVAARPARRVLICWFGGRVVPPLDHPRRRGLWNSGCTVNWVVVTQTPPRTISSRHRSSI